MNYSLETFNGASVGGWVRREKGVVAQVKAAAAFPTRNLHPLLVSPSLLFTSLFLLSTFHPAAPSPTMFLFSFTSLFPQCSPILIMDTWHSTCSVLCVVVPFFITGLNCKNPYMEQNSVWQLHGCKDIWLCLLDFYSHVHIFVCFEMLGILRGVFESS